MIIFPINGKGKLGYFYVEQKVKITIFKNSKNLLN